MKLFTGWIISAGLIVATGAANAQVPAPYEAGRPRYTMVSDFGGRYAAMPPDAPVPGYGPRLLPSHEVYTVLRESGFSPLGIPRLRGFVYTISVIDRGGDDGRLVIDARNGRILRFVPANRLGHPYDDALTHTYIRPGPPPPASAARDEPPSRAAPKVASRSAVPIPKPSPRVGEARPPATQQAAVPVQQPATAPAVRAEPRTVGQTAAAPAATAPAAVAAPAAPIDAKPAPQILPTQDMPSAQGLE